MNRKQLNFFLVSGMSLLGSVLTTLCISNIAAQTGGEFAAVSIVIAFYVAIGLGGVLSGTIGNLMNTVNTLLAIEIFRIFILVICLLSKTGSIAFWITIAFLFNVSEGVFHANKYSLIRKSLPDQIERNNFISKLQGIDSFVTIAAPVAAGIIVAFVSPHHIFAFDLVTYFLSFLFFLKYFSDLRNEAVQESTVMEGYSLIFKRIDLLKMNLARICNNTLYTVWNALLPVLCLRLGGTENFSRFNGILTSIVAVSVFCVNMSLPRFFADENSEKKFIQLGFVTSLMSLVLISVSWLTTSLAAFCLTALCMGLSTAGYRTSGIMIGQRITPPEKMHLVISAGDGVVRLASVPLASATGFLIVRSSELSAVFYSLIFILFVAVVAGRSFFQQASASNVELPRKN